MADGVPDAPVSSGLLQLPPELLRGIWRTVQDCSADPLKDLQALRCTCRAIRETSAPLISSLHVDLDFALDAADGLGLGQVWQSLLKHATSTLDRFPAQSTLTYLQWSCQDNSFSLDVPLDILPGVLHQGQARLAHLTGLRLDIFYEFTYGDASSIADTCPLLTRFALENASVGGPAFTPLSRLQSLCSLALENIRTPYSHGLVLSSLRQLASAATGLTSLILLDDFGDYDEDEGEERLATQSVLAFVSSLQSLRSLELTVLDGEDSEGAVAVAIAGHVSGLRHLTTLHLHNCQLLAAGGELACSAHLVDLTIDGLVLTPEWVRMLAAMPSLTRLTAGCFISGSEDLSGLPCAWEKLSLDQCPDAKCLVRLPTAQLRALRFLHPILWTLEAADGLEGNLAVLQAAATILDRCWKGHDAPESPSLLRLQWDAEPPFPTHSIFAALAPLRRRYLALNLGTGWSVSEEHAARAAECLPRVKMLVVSPLIPGFRAFTRALGDSAWLDRLGVACLMEMTRDMQDGLLELAARRTAGNHSLTILGAWSISKERREAFNQLLAVQCAVAGGSCVVRFEDHSF